MGKRFWFLVEELQVFLLQVVFTSYVFVHFYYYFPFGREPCAWDNGDTIPTCQRSVVWGWRGCCVARCASPAGHQHCSPPRDLCYLEKLSLGVADNQQLQGLQHFAIVAIRPGEKDGSSCLKKKSFLFFAFSNKPCVWFCFRRNFYRCWTVIWYEQVNINTICVEILKHWEERKVLLLTKIALRADGS